MNWQLPLGIVAFVAGGLLAMVPRYVPRPSGEMELAGTWWFVGLPVALVGLALVVWDWSLRRPTR